LKKSYPEEKLSNTVVTLRKPGLNRNYFKEVVSESDGNYRNRRHVEHRVKIADLADERYVQKVLIEKILDPAWVSLRTVVSSSTECKVGQHPL
jgi:hypothetical protein